MNNVSIIVTCQEQELELRRLLPRLLSVQYASEYEVIVVDMIHDKDLEEWLEEMEVHNPHLSHTFCPASAKGVDVIRLALTLGAKAANFDWLLLLPVDTEIPDENWLMGIMNSVDGKTDVVVHTKKKRLFFRKFYFSLFRRSFTIFHPTSSIVVCRRGILLQRQVVKLSNCKFI